MPDWVFVISETAEVLNPAKLLARTFPVRREIENEIAFCSHVDRDGAAINLLLLRIFDRWRLHLVRRIFISVLRFFFGLRPTATLRRRSRRGRRFCFGAAFWFRRWSRRRLFGLGMAEPGLSNIFRPADRRRFLNRFAFRLLQVLRLFVGQLDLVE